MVDYYIQQMTSRQSDFSEMEFRRAYALLGAQRNAKIVGIFARLCKRDGKPIYLDYLPRVWRYLEGDMAHPDLGALRGWVDTHIPASIRHSVPKV